MSSSLSACCLSPRAALLTAVLMLASTLVLLSCDDEPPPPAAPNTIEILSLSTPTPILQGSLALLTVRGIEAEGGHWLELQKDGEQVATLLESESPVPGALAFAFDESAMARIGVGTHQLDLLLFEGDRHSDPYPASLTLAQELAISLTEGIQGIYHRNESVILDGDGFLDTSEGTVIAEFVGNFTDEDGTARAVLAKLPVLLAEQNQRQRGRVSLTTELGGIKPGRFVGSLTLNSESQGGASSKSAERDVDLEFIGPELYSFSPERPYLGQLVTVNGAGLLGDAEREEATIIVFEGELELPDETRVDFGPKEAVVVYQGEGKVLFGLDAEVAEGELISSFFGVRRGHFRGTIAPVVLQGTQDVRGDAIPAEFVFGGMKQMVQVSFLPSFYESLRYYGLAAASEQLTERAIARMQDLWSEYNIVFQTEEVSDFLPGAVSKLEIGGPDPNGLGMFGYDNTPGKDIGNLRLFDSIGGANAQTQADNYPGYGGVFIDSFMLWSSHPADVKIGSGGQDPDPLFDEIFDPVRAQAVTLEEARGNATGERAAQVERAIRAFSSIIGETAAHEVGHSLGLSQPHGPPNAYHLEVPGDGCLMDSGGFRPLTERAAEPGAPKPTFCADEPEYLGRILPKD
ncbi:MAG: hypothetical protein RBU37_16195 [Myxococcota bacterium]|jgi:hypothetical protein|nr:hypothetical protein [Myxococcota bacterium]